MKTAKKVIPIALGVIGLILLVAYIGGAFSGEKVPPGRQDRPERGSPTATVKAERRVLPVWYDAVGTVRSVRQIQVSAQVQARIASVGKKAGDAVKAGEALIRMDDAEFQSRLRQAKQGVTSAQAGTLQARQSLLSAQAQVRQMQAHRLQAVQTLVQTQAQLAQAEAGLGQATQRLASAQAGLEQARSEHERVKKFRADGAATPQQFEVAEAAFKQAVAGVGTARQGVVGAEAQVRQLGAAIEQAKQGVSAAEAQVEQSQAAVETAKEGVNAAESQVKRAVEVVTETGIALNYTTLVAPEDGVVAERLSEPGDMAWPGKPLLLLHNPKQLRLEANVPESLLDRARPGTELPVVIDAVGLELKARVDEVAPTGDPRSRTFLVKALLPPSEQVFPGMFGRLRLKESERETVLAPSKAIRRVGQLETVLVQAGNGWRERFVRTGASVGDSVEVLSGLTGDETLGN